MDQTTTTSAQLQKFSMRGLQLLSHGRTMDMLAQGEFLTLHTKVYAEGGENSLHAHDDQDHAFFVLQGEMTVTGEDETNTVIQPYEGMMIPRGGMYMFKSTGEENLVILRVAASVTARDVREVGERRSIDGGAIRNAGEPVAAEGQYFGV